MIMVGQMEKIIGLQSQRNLQCIFAAAALLLSLAFYAPQKWTGPIGSFTRGMGLGI